MITDFTETDRIILFNNLTYDEIKKEIDERKFEDILMDKFGDFVAFCEKVEQNAENIKAISSFYEDGELRFDIKYK